MTILLRTQKLGLYFQDSLAWTANPDRARHFANSLEAIALVLREHIQDVEIVLSFGAGDEVSLPLGMPNREKPLGGEYGWQPINRPLGRSHQYAIQVD